VEALTTELGAEPATAIDIVSVPGFPETVSDNPCPVSRAGRSAVAASPNDANRIRQVRRILVPFMVR
jgi:hypothetical protein